MQEINKKENGKTEDAGDFTFHSFTSMKRKQWQKKKCQPYSCTIGLSLSKPTIDKLMGPD